MRCGDPHLARVRVLDSVRQSLADDEVRGGLELRGQPRVDRELEVRRERGSLAEIDEGSRESALAE